MPSIEVRSQDNRACGRVGTSRNMSFHTDMRNLEKWTGSELPVARAAAKLCTGKGTCSVQLVGRKHS